MTDGRVSKQQDEQNPSLGPAEKAGEQGARAILEHTVSLFGQPNPPDPKWLARKGNGLALSAAVVKARDFLASEAPAETPAASEAPAEKYNDTLVPFLAMMRAELHANTRKGDRPGWLTMAPDKGLLEIYWHTAKLSVAVRDGNEAAIREHCADVANMAMMLADVCGVLPAALTAPAEAGSAPLVLPEPYTVAELLGEPLPLYSAEQMHEYRAARPPKQESRPLRESLSDHEIDGIAETMPGGLEGFLKSWGWRQYARAVEAAVHGDTQPNQEEA